MKRQLPFSVLFCVAVTLLLTHDARPVLAQDSGEEASNTATAELVEDPDGDQQVGRLPSAARRESLKRRAGEKIGDDPQGRAMVLGMHIQESDFERAKVVDVAPASPAFDAGIRKGDEIVSFDGFRTNKYREWIDGMRRLASDAPDGDSLPIVLVRGDERINLRLRVPESPGILPTQDELAINQQVLPAPQQPGAVIAGQQPTQPIGGGGDNVLVADAFGNQFLGDNTGGATEAAIAEIFAVNSSPNTPPAQSDTTSARTRNAAVRQQQLSSTTPSGARIGLAGFRNDANGLFVMVDVGGLPPGNYIVGIDDPSVLTPSTFNNNNNNIPPAAGPARSGALDPARSAVPPATADPADRRVVPLDGNQPTQRSTPATGNRPGAAPASGQPSGGTGSSEPQSRIEIPRDVLAQVVDPNTPTLDPSAIPGATPSENPGVTTPQAPPTGEVIPPGGTETSAANTNVPGSATPTTQIGTLTVDQSGTGRLQQVVEGVSVQDVVGQAIAIYSTNATQPNTTLPPNLDNTVDTTAEKTDRQVQAAGPENVARSPNRPSLRGRVDNNVDNANRAANSNVVAGGIIRMMSDPTTTPGATTDPAAAGQSPEAQLQGTDTATGPATEVVQ